MTAMNYSAEIADVMQELSDLNSKIAKRKKTGAASWDLRTKISALHQRENELRKRAAKEFAKRNGWRLSERSFMVRTLVRAGTHDAAWTPGDPLSDHRSELFDHAVFFRERGRPYRTVAIVGQPYGHVEVETARARAHELGLELHVPPNVGACWWFPNNTQFFVFTRPGTAVQFLPEQTEQKQGAA